MSDVVNGTLGASEAIHGGYSLGLDIGTNSIGWALVGAESGTLLGCGVRVFPAGTEKGATGSEQPLNAARRMARQARRQGERRRRRWRNVAIALAEAGLLPLTANGTSGPSPDDPYELRSKALTEKLTPHEVGRAIYHLGKRRGFKSSRKDLAAKQSEIGPVKEQIGKLSEAMKSSGHKSLGEHLDQLRRHGGDHRRFPAANAPRLRSRYISRQMVEEEFDAIWNSQRAHHPGILTDEARGRIHHAIFHQRKLKPQSDKIGRCSLEELEPRASQESWFVHQFRLLQEVNNLRVLDHRQRAERRLTPEERTSIVREAMTRKSDLSFEKMRKLLGLTEFDRFNLEEADRTSIKNQVVEAELASIFKGRWSGDATYLRESVWEEFINLEPDEARERAASVWKISAEQLEKMFKVRAGSGYSRYSIKAIRKLLPHLESGASLHDALEAEYPERAKAPEFVDHLPALPKDGIANPVVTRSLSEARKVVNAIIREWGKPGAIRVELMRDAKGSIKKRDQQIARMRANERDRKRAVEELVRHGIQPSADNILKFRLWEECEHVCPYTGKRISREALFAPQPQFDIEHIFPYSQSLDNGFMNKTLCDVEENRKVKRNRLPFDAYSHDAPRWEEMQNRVMHLKRMPYPKRKRFTAKEIPEDFKLSQLTDTSYAARQLCEYLRLLGCPVRTVRGSITSSLRAFWGLNTILPRREEEVFDSTGRKVRADHRHHAIDAIVVAATEQRHIHRLSQRFQDTQFKFDPPWEGFRDHVEQAVAGIIVSHRPEHKLMGGLTKDTNYGRLKAGPHAGRFVRRVPVESLKPAMLERICDDTVRRVVQQAYGDGKNKNWFAGLTMPCKTGDGPPIRKVRVWERKGSLIPIPEADPYRFVESAENHHIVLYATTDKRGKPAYTAWVTSRYDALRRKQRGEAIVLSRHPQDPNARPVLWLMKGDMVLWKTNQGEELLYTVQTLSGPPSSASTEIVLRHHLEATIEAKSEPQRIRLRSVSADALQVDGVFRMRKVTVDPIGRIHPCNDVPHD